MNARDKIVFERITNPEDQLVEICDSSLPQAITDKQINIFVKDIIPKNGGESLIVPIVCEDMFEFVQKDKNGEIQIQSLHSHMVEYVLNELKGLGTTLKMTNEELEAIIQDRYYGTSLLKRIAKQEICDFLYDSVIEIDNETETIRDGIRLNPAVREFLLAGNFPLIVTTNCFDIIENELGKGYESIWNEISQKKDVSAKCVFHLFGQAASGDGEKWGHDDQRRLRFIQSSLTNDYSLSSLKTKLENKKLFVLGNDCPDWLFRFMLLPLCDKLYKNISHYYSSAETRKEEPSLDEFLRDTKFVKATQLEAFLGKVTEKLKKKSVQKYEYDYFISHNSMNDEIAKTFADLLRDKGKKVWIDDKNLRQGYYWDQILDGIKKSRKFLLFITNDYLKQLGTNNYYKKLIDRNADTSKWTNIDFSKECCSFLTKEWSFTGLQVELVMTQLFFNRFKTKNDVYSVPVLVSLKGIDNAEDLLPKELYAQDKIQFLQYDPDNPADFDLMEDERQKTNEQ